MMGACYHGNNSNINNNTLIFWLKYAACFWLAERVAAWFSLSHFISFAVHRVRDVYEHQIFHVIVIKPLARVILNCHIKMNLYSFASNCALGSNSAINVSTHFLLHSWWSFSRRVTSFSRSPSARFTSAWIRSWQWSSNIPHRTTCHIYQQRQNPVWISVRINGFS